MNYRHALAVLALVLGLSGCASTSSNYQSDDRYQDGSYYSPANEGHGDYYYAPEPRYNNYYDHSYFYGSPFYSFGGYCSLRYRYCPGSWYDPFWGSHGYNPWPYYYRHHRRHDRDDSDESAPQTQADAPDVDVADAEPTPRPGRPRNRPIIDPTTGLPRNTVRTRGPIANQQEPRQSRPDRPRREIQSSEPKRSESRSSDDDSGGGARSDRRGERPRD